MGVIERTSDPTDVARELDAMKALAELLATLSPSERRRVLGWAWQFAGPTYRSSMDCITHTEPA